MRSCHEEMRGEDLGDHRTRDRQRRQARPGEAAFVLQPGIAIAVSTRPSSARISTSADPIAPACLFPLRLTCATPPPTYGYRTRVIQRLSHHCVLTQEALDRLQQPTLEAGQRACALRFGDPRVMAIVQAITGFTHLPRGFRNGDLRPHVEALLGRPYSTAQMTCDLRRLRL
jgi:hypothetical protein